MRVGPDHCWDLVAGRTILHSVIDSLNRIAFNGDNLQFLLIETSYHPFISLFHLLELVKQDPELAAIRKSTCIYTTTDTEMSRSSSQLRFCPRL
jgi:hypothetical protein